MLEITHDDIHSHPSKGILAAMSIKSRLYARSLIDVQKFRPPARLKDMQRIIMHANPHLDEYFATYLFRACLSDALAEKPVQEEVLYSHDNDIRAKQLWPDSVLIGFGGIYNGGAKRSICVYDEHVSSQAKRRDSSCSRIVLDMALGGLGSLRPALSHVYGEVDHIDSSGVAHGQHLGNIIKALHEVRCCFSRTPSGGLVSGSLDDRWKRAIIEAVFTAMAYAIENKVSLSDRAAVGQAVQDSLNQYAQHCPWKNDPCFPAALHFQKSTVSNIDETFREAVLKDKTEDGQERPRLDTRGRTIPQRLILPRIALACFECWGPVLGQVIMSHLWETIFVTQLWFQRFSAMMRDPVEKANSLQSSLGSFSHKQLDQCVETVPLPRKRLTDPKQMVKRAVWIVSLVASPDAVRPNTAMNNYVKKHNAALGLCLIENGRYGNRAVFKCDNFPYDRWERLVQRLTALEGDADDGTTPGAWHKTPSSRNQIAPFLVNGNRAHQYVPASSLDGDALAHLVVQDYQEYPST